jgi:hypothetical protein
MVACKMNKSSTQSRNILGSKLPLATSDKVRQIPDLEGAPGIYENRNTGILRNAFLRVCAPA